MKRTLKSTLIISYSVIALMIVLTLSILFRLTADKTFEQYAKKQQRSQIESIITQVNQLYDETNGTYDMQGIEIIGYAALQNGMFLHVQIPNREIDWDIKSHRAEECQMVLQHAESNMYKNYPNFKGGYVEEQFVLEEQGQVTGNLRVGYYGPYSLSDEEFELMRLLNNTLLIIGGIALLVVSVFGVWIARNVTKPITNVIHTAQRIAGGEYGAQTNEVSKIAETSDLMKSINEMSIELNEKEKQKRQITSDVVHELRTPLTNLQSHMEAMMDGVWELSTERLESCHAEILRLVGIVGQLQELYFLESPRQIMDKGMFDFDELCRSVFHDFEIKLKEKDIRFHMEMPEQTPVYADYYRLKQCLINLISNALTYTQKGGHIVVEYSRIGEMRTAIKVKDDGPGIPVDDLPHLFERFYRVDKSRSKKTGGMGIGLSITKAIIEKHGGIIYAENDEKQGTIFTIILPNDNFI